VESVIAASFLDGGMAAAEAFIRRFILCNVPAKRLQNVDHKTALQEQVQKKKDQKLVYTLVEESGPDHDKSFVVEVTLNGKVVGKGMGTSKKRAEQDAARAAMEALFS
jgi:ribonuclease-3